jgi:GH24 family phage-related lysozyme (muramidase)/peptidoglycan hydrolase-like protein with peptidoglycan-binding domain
MAMSEYYLRIDRFTQNRFTGDPEVDVNPERIDREKNLHVYLTGNIRPDRSVKLIAFKSPSPSAKPAAEPENPPPYLVDAESAAAQSYKASLPHYSLPDRSTVYLLKAFDDSGQPWAVTSHELTTTDAVLTSDLTVDEFPRDSEETAVVAAARPVDTQLTDGPGIFGYYPASKRWGTASTVAALREVGRIWRLRRQMPRVGVGDISLRGGGDIEGHASHETGRDVDMRPIRNDGTEGPLTWGQANYSRALTQELIDIIYANGVVKVNVIGFNDPGVQGCVNWVNHDNHLHVRFYFQDGAPGYPLLKFGMNNSPPVRECQRRLNNWKQMQGDTDRLTPDGDFGQNTLQAVQDFQAAMGLVADGKVGNDTWKRTLDYLVSESDELIPVTAEVDGGMDWAQDLRRTLTTALTQLAHVDAIGIDALYSDVRPVLRPGSTGDAVGMLQAMLRALQFDLEVDRCYGPATALAIKVFQRDLGLRADGMVGPMTWDALEHATAAASDGEPRRYWPVGPGHVITSPWGWRPGGFHYGTDFGFPGGSAGKPVYAVQSGTVQYAGAAQGYGGPDPAGWLVIDSSRAEGGGCAEYGHIIREVAKNAHVTAGQRIARINPDRRTNGGVAPHLHLSVMPRAYDPWAKIDPVPWLGNAITPGAMPAAAKAEHTLSEEGVRFIAHFEGFRSRLYNDPGGHCTIGYGHLVHHGRCNGNEPEEFKRGITRERGLELLGVDADIAERAVNRRVQVVLTQHQFDALVSFVFNVGVGAFGGSTLLRRLNGGEYDAVPAELMRWVYSGGTQQPGLVRRRRAEGVLFSQGDYGDIDVPAHYDVSEGPYAIVDVPAESDYSEGERNDDRANTIEKPGADQSSM